MTHLPRLSLVPALVTGCVLLGSPAMGAHGSRWEQFSTTPTGLDGSWVIESSASIVGFRAREKYLSLPVPSEVVGRTSVVQGQMQVIDSEIVSTDVRVDMRTLKSDDSRRDDTLRTSRGPRWNRYPQGTFKLNTPIMLAGLQPGTVKSVLAVGVLRLHATARRVRFPLQLRWDGNYFEAAGQLATKMTDFGFQPPSVAGLTTVSDAFTIEVKLTFVRAG
jgi:polyisoprenoid-binding protein YceI